MSVISGLLITGLACYKISPVVGTVLAALACSCCDDGLGTTLLVASVYCGSLELPRSRDASAGWRFRLGEPRDLGVATSASTFFRSLGGSFGTALFGAIFTSQVAANIARNLPGADLGGADLTSSPGVIAQLPEGVRAGVIQAFADSTSTVFLAAVPFAIVAFVVVLLLPELPLRDKSHVGPALSEGAEGLIVEAAD